MESGLNHEDEMKELSSPVEPNEKKRKVTPFSFPAYVFFFSFIMIPHSQLFILRLTLSRLTTLWLSSAEV